jgi:hypothetical protein
MKKGAAPKDGPKPSDYHVLTAIELALSALIRAS